MELQLPDRDRLSELREQGIVPYSPFLTRASVAAAVLGVVLYSPDYLSQCVQRLKLQPTPDASLIEPCLVVPGQAALGVVGVAVVAALLVGLFQTRMLLHAGLISMQGTKLRRFTLSAGGDIVAILLAALVGIVGAMIAVPLAWSRLLQLSPGPVAFKGWDSDGILFLWIGSLVLFGVGGWFAARRRFMLRHRMKSKGSYSGTGGGEV